MSVNNIFTHKYKNKTKRKAKGKRKREAEVELKSHKLSSHSYGSQLL
jgi:subtilase family serine protease